MQLNVRAYALAAAAWMAILGSLCSLLVAIAPVGFMQTVGYLTHINLVPLTRTITWASYFAGIVAWTLATGLVAGLFAWTYNTLLRTPSARLGVSMIREEEVERARR